MSVGQNIASYLDGPFAPVKTEDTFTDLKIVGELPRDLHGIYVQNSPNPRFQPEGRYHWFDGDGMVHGIHLADGRATYRNRYIRTRDFQSEGDSGRALWGGLMDKIGETPRGPDKDTANTDLEWHAGKLLALWWLGGDPMVLSAPGLETLGVASFASGMTGGVAAHPKVDRRTGEMMFFDYSPYEAPFLSYGVVSAEGELVHRQPIEVPGPRLFHDIAITANFTILMDLPMLWRRESLAHGRRSVDFDPELPSRFGLIPRHGGDVRWFEAPSCYVYHTINAWEEGDEVVLWGCRIDNPIPKVPHSQEPEIPRLYFLRMAPYLWEWRMNVKTGQITERQVDDVRTEFPRIHDGMLGQKTRYAYSARLAKRPQLLFDGVIKYDLTDGSSQTLVWPEDHVASEAVFVPREGATEEDDGYLVAYLQNLRDATTSLVVANAKDPDADPICRVELPRRIPIGFHACWVPGSEESK